MALVHVVDRRKRRGFPGRRSPHRAVGHVALGSSWPAARGRPCRVAGRSLQASCLPLSRRRSRFAILAALDQRRRLPWHGRPLADPRGEGGRAV